MLGVHDTLCVSLRISKSGLDIGVVPSLDHSKSKGEDYVNLFITPIEAGMMTDVGKFEGSVISKTTHDSLFIC